DGWFPDQSSHLAPQLRPRVVFVKTVQLLPQLARLHVMRRRDGNFDFHDFIAALVVARCGRHAFFPQTQLLSALRSRRNFQLGSSIDGRHFDPGSQCRFPCCYWDSNVNVVAFATKYRVLAHANDDVKIARRAALRPCIAFAGDANALAIARAGFYADFQRLCALHCAFAMAHRARRLHLASATATRASNVELHAATGLRNMPASVALRAGRRSTNHSTAVAVGTSIKARDVQAHHRAADRVPEADVHLIFKIGAALRPNFRGRATASSTPKDAGENITEAASAA